MDDQQKLKLIADARLLAIEFIITRLFADAHQSLTDEEFDALVADYWLELDVATIPGLDAATSDAMAGEVRDTVQQLLVAAKAWRRTA